VELVEELPDRENLEWVDDISSQALTMIVTRMMWNIKNPEGN
jgi:hypothetical protein